MTRRKSKTVPVVSRGEPPKKVRWLTKTRPVSRREKGVRRADPVAVARARAKEIRAELLRDYKAAVKQFKPSKAQRGKIVYLAEPSTVGVRKGKKPKEKITAVPRSSRRKTYAVYVDTKGKVSPHIEPKRDWLRIARERIIREGKAKLGRRFKMTPELEETAKIRAEVDRTLADVPKKVAPKYHDVLAGRFAKQARKQLRAQTRPVRTRIDKETGEPEPIRIEKSSTRNMTWETAVVNPVVDELQKAWSMMRGVNKDLIVNADIEVELDDVDVFVAGKKVATVKADDLNDFIAQSGLTKKDVSIVKATRWFSVQQKFQARYYQDFSSDVFRDYAERKLYADFAQQLAAAELVSQGSASHVRRLSYNKGRDRSQWAHNSRGERWEKHDFQVVKITKSIINLDSIV